MLCVFDKIKKHKKINRTSSDLMDKINQNRHKKEGWEGDWRRGEELSPHLANFRFFVNFYCRLEL